MTVPKRPRVLILTKGLEIGGAETLAVSQIRLRDADAFDYSLAYVRADLGRLSSDVEDAGVEAICLNGKHDLNPGWVRRLRRLVIDRDIDLVHSHQPYVAALTRPTVHSIRRERRPVHVYTEHNVWSSHELMTRLGNRLTMPLDAHTFTVSGGVRDSMTPRLGERAEVLTQGIDLSSAPGSASREAIRKRLGISETTVVVGCVANHRSQKGLQHLLGAAKIVLNARSDVVFVQIGEGPQSEQLRAQHGALQLGSRFQFLGRVPNAVELMAGMDVLTLSSLAEGLPVVTMEAAARGLPVVATAVGGLPEIVAHGTHGLLVAAADEPALASALLALINDPERRRLMGAVSRKDAVRFDIRSTIQRVESVYRSLLLPAPERR